MSGTTETKPSAPALAVPQIFADGYEGVLLHDTVIRINLVANHKMSGEQVEATPVAWLVLPLPGFLRIYAGFSEIVRELEERGVLQKTQGREDANSPGQ